ncbi:MAG: heavy-metal-associated domain-containing protein [Phycisphaeraceae bacterium]
MKTLATTALALCLLVFIGCAEGNAPSPDTEAAITNATNKVEANVTGMDCSGCSSSIASAVEGIDDVTACKVDLKTGDVSVALTDDADGSAKLLEVEKVIQGLSDGKFTVNTITLTTDNPETEVSPEPPAKDLETQGNNVIEDIKEQANDAVNDAVKDIEIPSLGGE